MKNHHNNESSSGTESLGSSDEESSEYSSEICISEDGNNFDFVKVKERDVLKKCIGFFWSLRCFTICAFTSFVILNSSLIWLIGFISAQFSIKKNSDKATLATKKAINDTTYSLFGEGMKSLDTSLGIFSNYHLNSRPLLSNISANEEEIGLIFHQQIKTQSYTMLGVGTEQGEFLAIESFEEGYRKIVTRKTLFNSSSNTYENRFEFFTINNETSKEELDLETPNNEKYDPRLRSWYQQGKSIDSSSYFSDYAWIEIFKTVTIPSHLALSVTKKFVDKSNGDHIGVFLAIYKLSHLSEYLQSLDYLTIILQKDGTVVATSIVNSYEQGTGNYSEILKGHQHPIEIVKDSCNFILSKFGSYEEINAEQISSTYFFDSKGALKIMEVEEILLDNMKFFSIVVIDFFEVNGISIVSNAISIVSSMVLVCIGVIGTTLIGFLLSSALSKQARKMQGITNFEFKNSRRKKTSKFQFDELKNMEIMMEKMRNGLGEVSKFLPLEILKAMISEDQNFRAVRNRYISILFVDIEKFTTISESISPAELLKMLTTFFSVMERIVLKNHGVIDKYIGDCCMVLFGAPSIVKQHELCAVLSGIQMLKDSKKIKYGNPRTAIKIRVGINSASCLIGTIGSPLRLSYTALGDAVNLASRLEGANKCYETRILISENTYKAVKEKIVCKWLDNISVRGKSQKTNIFEVLATKKEADESMIEESNLHNAIRELIEQKRIEEAKVNLKKIFFLNPANKQALKLLKKLESTNSEENRNFQNCMGRINLI